MSYPRYMRRRERHQSARKMKSSVDCDGRRIGEAARVDRYHAGVGQGRAPAATQQERTHKPLLMTRGNGCAGSTVTGVSRVIPFPITLRQRLAVESSSCNRAPGFMLGQSRRRCPFQQSYCSSTNRGFLVNPVTLSASVRPSRLLVVPSSILLHRAATRTSKNSSRLLAEMERNSGARAGGCSDPGPLREPGG